MIEITVVAALAPRSAREVQLTVTEGISVADAIKLSGLLAQEDDASVDALQLAIRGRAVDLALILREGDRIDLCRPLKVDPKMARRERFLRQGARGTGLFSKRRAVAKSGY